MSIWPQVNLTIATISGIMSHAANEGYESMVESTICRECHLDHDSNAEEAILWHRSHPCPHCTFDTVKGTHAAKCTVVSIVRKGMVRTEARRQCAECSRTVKNGYTVCVSCRRFRSK